MTSPLDGGVLGHVANQGAAETTAAIAAADAAFPAWAARTAKERSLILRKWYDLIVTHADTLAEIVYLEQGRPLKESRGEVLYGASFVEWFAEEAKRAYGRTVPATMPGKHLTTIKQPVGVCVAITPWNFPISMITRKVAPALAAGCTVVVKPSEETPLSALALWNLARQAGLPDGVLSIVTTLDASAVGGAMTGDVRVRKLSFTGSTDVGKRLYAQCAPTIKRISLELGGNAPFIVFDDADLPAAVEGLLASKFRNTGQTCVCANRILVQDGIYDAFAKALSLRVRQLTSTGSDAHLGPLINRRAFDKVTQLVDDARARGASSDTGDPGHGLHYPPTVLTGVTQDMAIFSTEIFGPVAPLYRFTTEAEAVELANDTPFGLAAYVFTRDIGRGMRMMRALDCGMVGVNDGVISTEATPFGGVKQSGIGREGAVEGLEEYLVTKYVSFGGLN